MFVVFKSNINTTKSGDMRLNMKLESRTKMLFINICPNKVFTPNKGHPWFFKKKSVCDIYSLGNRYKANIQIPKKINKNNIDFNSDLIDVFLINKFLIHKTNKQDIPIDTKVASTYTFESKKLLKYAKNNVYKNTSKKQIPIRDLFFVILNLDNTN